ncbi:hypothetical protein DFP72DRAFT_916232 [Ephemerocybe angulata]|uniref:Uncharacterized protein n=1 Tax=Ephemerocybe angulata TaxID=980116 RepID=A0A8H6HK70_9AGAR|nr:hypothetical protein DFP72DRAFT_916232 [Tulosesus angulatus]
MSDGRLTTILADFPQELVAQILSDGATISTQFTLNLCLVARWTRVLALPYLYSGAVLKTLSQSTKFYNTFQLPIPLRSYPYSLHPVDQLRGLWMTPASSRVVDIFRLSENIRNLALSAENMQWLIHSSVNTPLEPRSIPSQRFNGHHNFHLLIFNELHQHMRWTFAPGMLMPETDASPFFRKVTHIHLSQYLPRESHRLSLEHWTNLTHIAIPVRPFEIQNSRIFEQDIGHNPTLTHIVFIVYTDLLSKEDQAQVLRVIEQYGAEVDEEKSVEYVLQERWQLQRNWEMEQRGGPSIWDRAIPASTIRESMSNI